MLAVLGIPMVVIVGPLMTAAFLVNVVLALAIALGWAALFSWGFVKSPPPLHLDGLLVPPLGPQR